MLNVPAQYATIQAAITAAQNGDTVLIADGIYSGPGNRDLDFGGKSLTVMSQHGPARTILDCGGSSGAHHRGFYLYKSETVAVIDGLTIENGYEDNGEPGGGIYNGSASLTVLNCILKHNTANKHGFGGGIYSFTDGAFTLINCVFTGNAAGGGSGLFNETRSRGAFTLTHCTFAGNTASGGGVVYNFQINQGSGAVTLTDDIVYGDTGGEVINAPNSAATATATHCDIQGGYPGTGNIDADPLFVNAPGDLHLKPGSPCLGAGVAVADGVTDQDGKRRRNPPTLGAYEGADTR